MAEQTAGPSSGTAHNAAVQRAATTDDEGATMKLKHDPVRGAGREPVAGGGQEQK
jgi:hypothetical protein